MNNAKSKMCTRLDQFASVYQEVLWDYVHLWSLSTCDVVSILPLMEGNGVITKDEWTMINNQNLPVDKILLLFKQIMPTKDLTCHYALIDILKYSKQLDLAKILADRFAHLGLSPEKQKVDRKPSADNGRIRTGTIDMDDTASAIPTLHVHLVDNENLKKDQNSSEIPACMELSDFVNEKYLNRGASAKVYEATYRPMDLRVAIKKMQATLNCDESWKKEVEILKKVNHPNIVTQFGVVENLEIQEIWIVTELMNGGSLRPYCTGQDQDQLDHAQKMQISAHCWSALAYLHDKAKITHKDIKPENILLHKLPNDQLVAKLCDFGLAEIRTTLTVTEETRLGGTWMYYPPEFAESKRNPRKADVYSLGATLCELFTNLYFWHNPKDCRRLEDCQILYKLVIINQRITAATAPLQRRGSARLANASTAIANEDSSGPAAIALDKVANISNLIRDVLKRAAAFNRLQRPTASDILLIFQDAIVNRSPKHSVFRKITQKSIENELVFDFRP